MLRAMKIGALILGFALTIVAGTALAAPPKHTGFQLALRTGVAIPFGDTFKDNKLSDGVAAQLPLVVDIGGKVIPNLFLGGYLGIGVGGVGGRTADFCDAADLSCLGVGIRIGVEAQYHILPAEFVNPWIGYGIGYESLGVGISGNGGPDTSSSVGGLEFAHFMGGADFRLSRVAGIGPFIDVSLGRYGSQTTDNGSTTTSRDIDSSLRATHGWVMFGARVVFFP